MEYVNTYPIPSDIRNSILDEITRLGTSLTEQINFSYQASQEVDIHSAFRLQPDASPLVLGTPLIFGFMPRYGSMSILLEFVIKDIPADLTSFTLATGFINYEIPRHPTKTQYVQRQTFVRQITKEQINVAPPSTILDAMTLLSFYQMQERARVELEKGNFHAASRHMEILATQLLNREKLTLLKRSWMRWLTFSETNPSVKMVKKG